MDSKNIFHFSFFFNKNIISILHYTYKYTTHTSAIVDRRHIIKFVLECKGIHQRFFSDGLYERIKYDIILCIIYMWFIHMLLMLNMTLSLRYGGIWFKILIPSYYYNLLKTQLFMALLDSLIKNFIFRKVVWNRDAKKCFFLFYSFLVENLPMLTELKTVSCNFLFIEVLESETLDHYFKFFKRFQFARSKIFNEKVISL